MTGITTYILCRNCKHSHIYVDEQGNLLTSECELDIPFYDVLHPVHCSSYFEKN